MCDAIQKMNNYSYAAEEIKSRISMHDAIAMYAPRPAPRHNRIPCPIHQGDSFNLSFSEHLYHCFVCGDGGDVIRFVQHIFNIDFKQAIEKLNSDFHIGIPLERRMTLREQYDAQKRYSEIMVERERKEAENREYEALCNSLWDEWCRLDFNRMKYAPNDAEAPLHPLFVEALQKIDYQSYLIDSLL